MLRSSLPAFAFGATTPSQWVTRLAARSHPNVAVVAMANKTPRMAWAMLKNSTDYQPAMVTT